MVSNLYASNPQIHKRIVFDLFSVLRKGKEIIPHTCGESSVNLGYLPSPVASPPVPQLLSYFGRNCGGEGHRTVK